MSSVDSNLQNPTTPTPAPAPESAHQGVSVIIPTYNEVENIERIIDRCLLALSGYQSEILIVDDDSPDGTAAVAKESYADDDRVRVIRRTEDKGLAQSVTDGFRRVEHDYCAVIDADLQHPPEKLADLFQALDEGADIAVGSRHLDGGGIDNWPRSRKLISWGATQLARLALPAARSQSDPMSGFFAVRRDVVADVTLDPRGYKILLEVLTKGEYETVVEIPYVFKERERGESKLTCQEYKHFVEHLALLSVQSYLGDRNVDPNRVVRAAEFGLVGAIGTLVNTLVFGGLHLVGGLHYLLAGTVAFVVALNWNFLGNWALTFDQPTSRIGHQYVKFTAVSLGGFFLYSGLLAVTVDILSMPALFGNVLAIGGASVFNFLGSELFAFAVSAPH